MTLKLALVGSGGMAHRHLRGMKRLQNIGRQQFELVAVCDLLPDNAARLAETASELLGRRPEAFESLDDALTSSSGIDAVIVTTSPNSHDEVGIQALKAGAHVMVEKPITLTVRRGLDLVQAARTHGRKLSVAENYRRDPINRLAKAIIDAGILQRVFLAIQSSSGSGERVIITPWRHLRHTCGIGIDMGVHYADILEYLLGPVDSVVGMGDVIDSRRRDQYGTWHKADAEDLLLGVARFRNGALSNWVLNLAGRGEQHYHRIVYGTAGSLSVPRDRSGGNLVLTLRENQRDHTVSEADQLALVPDFALDDTTAALFGGERLTSYSMEWADVDANLLAIEQDDFARAILDDRDPEVTGEDGLRSLALVYGFLESERLGRILGIDELLSGSVTPYQSELAGSEQRRD